MLAVCETIGHSAAVRFGLRASQPYLLRDEKEKKWFTASEKWDVLATWQTRDRLSRSESADALLIFAFDSLTLNFDRREENPNVGRTASGLTVFDFDLCFAPLFVPLIGWDRAAVFSPKGVSEFKRHIFFRHLFATKVSGEAIERSVLRLDEPWRVDLLDHLPVEWKPEAVKILDFLAEAETEAAAFAASVCRVMTYV